MFRFLKIILVVFILLIALAVTVPFLVPAETIKNQVLAQIEAKTGRKVSMGQASFSLFPTLGLNAENVKIGNPDWAGGGDLAQMKTLKVGLELMPLLHKEIQLKDLTLEEPVITLIKQQGKGNWEFGKEAAQSDAGATRPAAATAPKTPAAPAKSYGGIPDLHLDRISITNGTIIYKDDTNKTKTVSEINLTLKAPDLREKAEASFSALYEGKKSTISVTLVKLRTLNEPAWETGAVTNVTLKGEYGTLAFTWDGTMAPLKSGMLTFAGKINIPTLNTADLKSSDEGAPSPAAAPSAGAGASAPASASAPPPENASRWSDAPISLDGLKGINANFVVSIGKLVLPKITLENVNTRLQLGGGVLNAVVDSLKAFDGNLSLALGANFTGQISLRLNVSAAQAEPLLHDLAGYDRLSGTIYLDMRITVFGNSERAYINSLAGTTQLSLKDGKLKGVDLAALVRNAVGVQSSENASTSFSEFSASFSIAKGVASTNDLKLVSPQLRMSGAGHADLPNWQEHFQINPVLLASSGGTSGITFPVDVDGPLNHPGYKPDLQAALQQNLKDPTQLKQNLKDIKKNLLGNGGLQNLLR